MTRAIDDIAWERRRQVEQEGYHPRADDCYTSGQLPAAAQSYVLAFRARQSPGTALRYEGSDRPLPPKCWPWSHHAWRPKDDRRDMVRAAALVAAEIDRVLRATNTVLTEPAQAFHALLLELRDGTARRVPTHDLVTAAIGLLQLQRHRATGTVKPWPAPAPLPTGGWPLTLRPWFSQGPVQDMIEAGALIALCIVRLDERQAGEARP